MHPVNLPIRVCQPARPLRAFISHYWLSLDNTDDTYAIVPDGSVDVVVTVGATTYQTEIFGTTTASAELPINVGCNYLGIRFKPGQSRHFLDIRASQLTDSSQPAEGLFLPHIPSIAESISADGLFQRLDTALLDYLKRHPPQCSRIDDAIGHIEAVHGAMFVSQLASMYGKSRRQLERNFVDAVGIPVKLFAEIIRFQQASTLLARSVLPLAQIAATLGYTDQSHLTREFSRFYGHPPSQARKHVAFLQDVDRHLGNNDRSIHTLRSNQ